MTKTSIITGGTRGIGRAISLKMAKIGYRVFSLYCSDNEAARSLEAQAKEENLNIACLRGNLTKKTALDDIVLKLKSQCSSIDCIVHAAASGVHRDLLSITEKELEFTVSTNVYSIHNLVIRLAGLMPKGGRIIGLTSSGSHRTVPLYAAIGISKAALEAHFKYLSSELSPRGISVNLVCPGLVLTDALNAFPDKNRKIKDTLAKTPSGRLTTAEDVAELVGFLAANPAATQIQGQCFTIDGGINLR